MCLQVSFFIFHRSASRAVLIHKFPRCFIDKYFSTQNYEPLKRPIDVFVTFAFRFNNILIKSSNKGRQGSVQEIEVFNQKCASPAEIYAYNERHLTVVLLRDEIR